MDLLSCVVVHVIMVCCQEYINVAADMERKLDPPF